MRTTFSVISNSGRDKITRKLEEVLGLPPMTEEVMDIVSSPVPVTKDEAMAEAQEVLVAMSNSDRIDVALTTVTGLLEHDNEMDDIADKAMSSYSDLCAIGENVTDLHIGKVYEVAATMLKTAMEAKDAKVSKKLKMLDLQLKKMKIDNDIGNGPEQGATGNEFDRNELLRHIANAQKSDDSDK